MLIKIKAYGPLKKYILKKRNTSSNEIKIDIDKDSTIEDIVNYLEIPEKELRFTTILINGMRFEKNKKILEGDTVIFLPLMGGG